jgi:hypothetical protein
MITVCSKIRTKHTKKVLWAELFDVKSGGTQSCYWDVKRYGQLSRAVAGAPSQAWSSSLFNLKHFKRQSFSQAFLIWNILECEVSHKLA